MRTFNLSYRSQPLHYTTDPNRGTTRSHRPLESTRVSPSLSWGVAPFTVTVAPCLPSEVYCPVEGVRSPSCGIKTRNTSSIGNGVSVSGVLLNRDFSLLISSKRWSQTRGLLSTFTYLCKNNSPTPPPPMTGTCHLRSLQKLKNLVCSVGGTRFVTDHLYGSNSLR